MNTKLSDIIAMLDAEIIQTCAKVAIVADQGNIDESSLVGTRDGYLRLARQIIAFVRAAEELDMSNNNEVERLDEE